MILWSTQDIRSGGPLGLELYSESRPVNKTWSGGPFIESGNIDTSAIRLAIWEVAAILDCKSLLDLQKGQPLSDTGHVT